MMKLDKNIIVNSIQKFKNTSTKQIEKNLEKIIGHAEQSVNYITNRFFLRTHMLRTGLRYGARHSYSKMVLHGMFNEFVQLVDEQSDQEYSLFDSDKEISQLYLWWIKKKSFDELYHKRILSIEKKKLDGIQLSSEEIEEYQQMIDKFEMFDEETEMLVRLIKIRDRIK